MSWSQGSRYTEFPLYRLYSSFVLLLEAPQSGPQLWRTKRYNVLETKLVYSPIHVSKA